MGLTCPRGPNIDLFSITLFHNVSHFIKVIQFSKTDYITE
jgi:hypothetical protein